MYKDELSAIMIQANQLSYIASTLFNLATSMQEYGQATDVDTAALKAYIASADIQMTSVIPQHTLLQQALDKLAGELPA